MTTDLAVVAKTALIRELEELRDAVRQGVEPLSEQQTWARPVEPGNSVGNLVLHLTGNLKHFVGAQLGGTGYVREREREFSPTQRLPKAELLAGLEEAVEVFRRVVEGLSAEQLAAAHPGSRFGTVLGTLTHLVAHFALHRGQMSYLVRLLPADK